MTRCRCRFVRDLDGNLAVDKVSDCPIRVHRSRTAGSPFDCIGAGPGGEEFDQFELPIARNQRSIGVDPPQVFQLLEVFQSGIRNPGTGDMEFFEIGESLQVNQAGVRDPGVGEVHPGGRNRQRQSGQVMVRNIGLGEIDSNLPPAALTASAAPSSTRPARQI